MDAPLAGSSGADHARDEGDEQLPSVAEIGARVAEINRVIADHSDRRVTLVGVTKTFPPVLAARARDAGLVDLGENYAQELAAKAEAVSGVRWHFIGGLQRNKVRTIADHVTLWHSVDRVELGVEIAKRRPGAAVLVQVNVSGASSQHGVAPAAVDASVAALRAEGLDVRGLMAIGRFGPPEESRPGFRLLRSLADAAGLDECSMGMSGDLRVALEEGATMVRIGTALFGPRATGAGR